MAAAAKRKTTRNARALVASAANIPLDDTRAAKAILGRRQEWQNDAWSYFDEVAEIKFGTLYLGNGMSKVEFYAAVQTEDGTFVPVNDEASPIAGTTIAKQAEQEMHRLRSLLGGQAELNRQGTINWSVCGEFFIHGIEAKEAVGTPDMEGYEPPEPEQWEVRSVSEIEISGSGSNQTFKVRTGPEDKPRAIDPERETVIRMWTRHARWSSLADCHMRALLGDCEALILMVNQRKAEARSRAAPGLLLVPSELSFSEDTEGGDPEEQPEQDPFVAALMKALTEPIEDPSAASSVMPLVISGPAEFLTPDRFRLLSFARIADPTLDDRIDAVINRIARGLNVPVEVVMGHMSTTFSNAEQIDEDTFTDHFEPLCMALADAYASGFLHPQLQSAGVFGDDELETVTVWFDPSRLVRGPAVTDSADVLHERGAISDEALRRYKGASDEDAPDDREWLRNLLGRKGQFDPATTAALLEAAGYPIGTEAPAVEAPAAPDVEAVEALIAAAQAPRSLGRRLSEIDRELRTKLLAAAEAAMARALERAGNRLRNRNKTLTAALRQVPAYRCAAHLGPALIASSGLDDDALLADAWDEFEVQFKVWSLAAADQTLDLLEAEAGMTGEARRAQRLRYEQQVNDAWEWLAAAMTRRAVEVLYAPERGALTAANGEEDESARIPPGIIREGIARAGGAVAIGGEDGRVEPSGSAPIGGIATGPDALSTLDDANKRVEGFVWVYGPAARKSFPDHLALDGVVFTNFDDPVLANGWQWWLGPYFYPGDHDGCLCDAEPIIIDGDRTEIERRMELDRARRAYFENEIKAGRVPRGDMPKIEPKQVPKIPEITRQTRRLPEATAAEVQASFQKKGFAVWEAYSKGEISDTQAYARLSAAASDALGRPVRINGSGANPSNRGVESLSRMLQYLVDEDPEMARFLPSGIDVMPSEFMQDPATVAQTFSHELGIPVWVNDAKTKELPFELEKLYEDGWMSAPGEGALLAHELAHVAYGAQWVEQASYVADWWEDIANIAEANGIQPPYTLFQNVQPQWRQEAINWWKPNVSEYATADCRAELFAELVNKVHHDPDSTAAKLFGAKVEDFLDDAYMSFLRNPDLLTAEEQVQKVLSLQGVIETVSGP